MIVMCNGPPKPLRARHLSSHSFSIEIIAKVNKDNTLRGS